MPVKFNNKATYTLEDERVLLRPLQLADLRFLLPFAINEPDTWKFSLKSAGGEDAMRNYIHEAIAAREAGKEYPFIVFDKQTQQYAGCTRFYDIQQQYNNVQLGYTWYGKNFQGTGLNKHCKYLLLQLAFETLGVERVEFRADSDNHRSIAAMQSIGCTIEGVSRSHLPKPNGTRRNSTILSILKQEWFSEINENLGKKLK